MPSWFNILFGVWGDLHLLVSRATSPWLCRHGLVARDTQYGQMQSALRLHRTAFFLFARNQGIFQIAHGLPQALFVFDQGDADEPFAVFAEGAAGGEGDFGFVHHAQAEVDGALAFEMLGLDLGPDEHAGAGFFVGPAETIEAAADDVAAVFVDLALLGGRDRRHSRMAMMLAIWIGANMP